MGQNDNIRRPGTLLTFEVALVGRALSWQSAEQSHFDWRISAVILHPISLVQMTACQMPDTTQDARLQPFSNMSTGLCTNTGSHNAIICTPVTGPLHMHGADGKNDLLPSKQINSSDPARAQLGVISIF